MRKKVQKAKEQYGDAVIHLTCKGDKLAEELERLSRVFKTNRDYLKGDAEIFILRRRS